MLSLILSRLFRFAFFITVLIGIINIIVQVRQSPIYYDKSKNGYSSIGEPGIAVNACVSSTGNERNAPDTTITYKLGGSSGQVTSNSRDRNWGKEIMDKLIADRKGTRDTLILDTQINIIRQQEWENIGYYTGSNSFDELADGRVVLTKELMNEKGKLIQKPIHDTFQDALSAKIFVWTNTKEPGFEISEGAFRMITLRVKPKNMWQCIIFVLYDVIKISSIALLLLMLSRLFLNFYKRDYFTTGNIKILKNIGWLLLVPELLQTLLYWGLLFKIHPAKIFTSSLSKEVKMTYQFQINADIEFKLVFLGLGIIVLSYIFKNGLKLKEEQILTI